MPTRLRTFANAGLSGIGDALSTSLFFITLSTHLPLAGSSHPPICHYIPFPRRAPIVQEAGTGMSDRTGSELAKTKNREIESILSGSDDGTTFKNFTSARSDISATIDDKNKVGG